MPEWTNLDTQLVEGKKLIKNNTLYVHKNTQNIKITTS